MLEFFSNTDLRPITFVNMDFRYIQNLSGMSDQLPESQLTFTCSMSVIETLEKGVKYV